MKKLIFILFLFPLFATAQSANEVFDLANLKYQEGKHDSAITLYNHLLNLGYSSHQVYFNAGNAHYKNGDYTNAILNYERALKLNPGNKDYKHNLKLANANIIDKIEAESLVFYEEAWQNYLSRTSANRRGIIGILLLWLAVALFTAYLFIRNTSIKKSTFFGSLAALVFGFLFLFVSFIQHRNENSNKHAIIFAESEYIKSSPDNDGKNLFMLHAGTKVKVIGELNNWKQIILPNGNSGWIINSSIETI